MISESGLQNPTSLRHLRALGFRGFLIGEALMCAPDPEATLRDLIASVEDRQAVITKSK
jgi:indole-3-glycerol phosphate synthase